MRAWSVVLGAILATGAYGQKDFADWGPYDRSIPTPAQVLGYAPGERHTTYLGQETYLQRLAEVAKDRVKVIRYGESWEKRPLRIVAVGEAAKIKRIDQLQAKYQQLAQGNPDAAKDLPALVWVNQTIHGDEAASFESSMWLLYNLVASRHPRFERMRKDALVIVNPCYNPDGHERYVVWYGSVAVGAESPLAFEHQAAGLVRGRLNRYRFDLNRDRIAFSQVETQLEVAEFMRWFPQVYVDQHGEVETYFFPPNPMSVNPHVDRMRHEKWTSRFGQATARAFDQRGWSYYVRDIYDFYSAGYLDTFASLTGSIGMTHETDSAELRLRNRDGSVRTLRDGMSKHLRTAFAVIETSAENRTDLLSDFVRFRKDSREGAKLGGRRHLTVAFDDAPAAERFETHLKLMGIVSNRVHGVVRGVEAESLWTGKAEALNHSGWLVSVNLAQPNGALARALLDPETNFEPEFVKAQRELQAKGESTEFYDLTAWALPLLYSGRAWWSSQPIATSETSVPKLGGGSSPVGYAVMPGTPGVAQAGELLREGYRLRFSPVEIRIEGLTLPPFTPLVLAEPNDAEMYQRLARRSGLRPLSSQLPSEGRYGPGSENVIPMRPARVGVVFGSSENQTSFGSAWFVLDHRLRIPFVPLSWRALEANLSEYTVLILPAGRYPAAPSDRLRAWIQDGGCLIILGHGYGVGSLLNLEPMEKKTPSVPGAIGAAVVRSHWLTAGVEGPLAIPIDGTRFYRSRDESPVIAEGTILSGWKWDESELATKDSVFAEVQSIGEGHVVWFAQDPTDRAMWPGLERLLQNAIVFGPRWGG